MKPIILVNGTGDYEPKEYSTTRWWKSGSRFTSILRSAGYGSVVRTKAGIEVPPWSGKLDGTVWSGKEKRSWYHAGESRLASDLLKLDPNDRWMICWSHGLQPAVIAAYTLQRMGEPITGFISVCSPLRRDLMPYYEAVIDAGIPWRHVYCKHVWGNRMQWMGSRGGKWEMPGADNVRLHDIGHGAILTDPDNHREQLQAGIISFLYEHYKG
jgi:hypothetical protein